MKAIAAFALVGLAFTFEDNELIVRPYHPTSHKNPTKIEEPILHHNAHVNTLHKDVIHADDEFTVRSHYTPKKGRTENPETRKNRPQGHHIAHIDIMNADDDEFIVRPHYAPKKGLTENSKTNSHAPPMKDHHIAHIDIMNADDDEFIVRPHYIPKKDRTETPEKAVHHKEIVHADDDELIVRPHYIPKKDRTGTPETGVNHAHHKEVVNADDDDEFVSLSHFLHKTNNENKDKARGFAEREENFLGKRKTNL